MFSKLKFIQGLPLRSYLVIGAGFLLSLLFLKSALPGRSTGVLRPASVPPPGNSNNPDIQPIETGTPAATNAGMIALAYSPAGKGCTYTRQYWAEHPEAWMADNIQVGQTTFEKEEILELFRSDAKDQVLSLQSQFLTAALNLLNGSDSNTIDPVLAEASGWLDSHPLGLEMPEADRQQGADLTRAIEEYNQGITGPGLCPDNPITPTPAATPTPTPTPTRTTARISLTAPEATRTPAPRREAGAAEEAQPVVPSTIPTETSQPTSGADTSPSTTPVNVEPPSVAPTSTPPPPTTAPTSTESPPPQPTAEPLQPTENPPTPAPEPTQQRRPTRTPRPTDDDPPPDDPEPTVPPQPTDLLPTEILPTLPITPLP